MTDAPAEPRFPCPICHTGSAPKSLDVRGGTMWYYCSKCAHEWGVSI